jgi:hypothetical protein
MRLPTTAAGFMDECAVVNPDMKLHYPLGLLAVTVLPWRTHNWSVRSRHPRSSGSGNPRSHWMRPAISGSGLPGVATTCSRLTPSVMKPYRSWRRCADLQGTTRLRRPTGSAGAFMQSGHEFMFDAVKGAPPSEERNPACCAGLVTVALRAGGAGARSSV